MNWSLNGDHINAVDEISVYKEGYKMKKILAFAASNSSKSINKQLVSHAARTLKAKFIVDADIEILDLNDYEMPIFSSDREEADGIPDLAHAFFKKITDADVVLISYAEHNGSYSAAYKNIFDWASRINSKVFQNKSMVLFSTSPGKGGASSVLTAATNSAPHFHAEVKASLSVPSFYANFDSENGALKNTDIQEKLETALSFLF